MVNTVKNNLRNASLQRKEHEGIRRKKSEIGAVPSTSDCDLIWK